MICNIHGEFRTPYVMDQVIITSNRGLTVEDIVYRCPYCKREVHDTPSDTMFELRSYFGTQCWTCARMDLSEYSAPEKNAEHPDQREWPGRCYHWNYRIRTCEFPPDGKCEHFLLRQSKLRDRLLHTGGMK